MQNILAARHRAALQRFAQGSVLAAFDYDGTLAPIVADRDRARMQPLTRARLARVARLYPCAVISGRARASVERFLAGIPLVAIVGNHGAEWPGRALETRRFERLARSWKRALERALEGAGGVEIEDKGVSLAVHYRQAKDKPRARRAVATVAARLEHCRVVPGIEVLNLVPRSAPHKGGALLRLLRETGARRALYVGDDVTDEDVFALRSPRVWGVRVGRTRASRARWYVPDRSGVDVLLQMLAELAVERR